jgi:hypothetical protein
MIGSKTRLFRSGLLSIKPDRTSQLFTNVWGSRFAGARLALARLPGRSGPVSPALARFARRAARARASASEALGHHEGQVETLGRIEPGIAHRLVPQARSSSLRSAPPPRHSVTSSPVSSTWIPAGPGPRLVVGVEEPADLGAGRIEMAGLAATRSREGVAVHRIARPHDRVTGSSRTASSSGGRGPRPWSAPMRVMRVNRPGNAVGVERSQIASTSAPVAVGRACSPAGCGRPGGTRRGRRRAGGCARRSTACAPSSRTSHP